MRFRGERREKMPKSIEKGCPKSRKSMLSSQRNCIFHFSARSRKCSQMGPKKLPKWNPTSQLYCFLGLLKKHRKNINFVVPFWLQKGAQNESRNANKGTQKRGPVREGVKGVILTPFWVDFGRYFGQFWSYF